MDFVVNYIAVYFHGIALNIERKHDNVLAKGWWCDPDGRLKLMFVIVHFNVALCYIVLHCMTWHGGVLAKGWWCACDPDVRLQWTFELEQGPSFPGTVTPIVFSCTVLLPLFSLYHDLPLFYPVPCLYHIFTIVLLCAIHASLHLIHCTQLNHSLHSCNCTLCCCTGQDMTVLFHILPTVSHCMNTIAVCHASH